MPERQITFKLVVLLEVPDTATVADVSDRVTPADFQAFYDWAKQRVAATFPPGCSLTAGHWRLDSTLGVAATGEVVP